MYSEQNNSLFSLLESIKPENPKRNKGIEKTLEEILAL